MATAIERGGGVDFAAEVLGQTVWRLTKLHYSDHDGAGWDGDPLRARS